MQCGECRLVPTWPVMISHADDFNSVTTSNPTQLSQHPSPVSASHVTIFRLNVLYFAPSEAPCLELSFTSCLFSSLNLHCYDDEVLASPGYCPVPAPGPRPAHHCPSCAASDTGHLRGANWFGSRARRLDVIHRS